MAEKPKSTAVVKAATLNSEISTLETAAHDRKEELAKVDPVKILENEIIALGEKYANGGIEPGPYTASKRELTEKLKELDPANTHLG